MYGHGTFVYNPDFTIDAFGSVEAVVDALKQMGMSHAWLRVHNKNGAWHPEANLALAQAFRANGIEVGVWGWNDGNDVDRDIANAVAAINRYQPYAYIADMENGVSGASWTVERAKKFAAAVKAQLTGRPLVVSSFGYIVAHEPEIMTAVDGLADAFAPQVYWFRYPKQSMLPGGDPVLGGLPTDDAPAYAKVCLHHWRKYVTKPLILTGQAYWGEADGWTQNRAEKKLKEFLAGFDLYDQIVGLNWWNLADSKAMSGKMRTLIAEAKLGEKFGGAQPPKGPAEHPAVVGGGEEAGPAGPGRKKFIAAEGLYFRSAPEGGTDQNIIATLAFGDVATVYGDPTPNGYLRATVDVDGERLEGFISNAYLRDPEAPQIERLIQEAVDQWERFDRGNGIETNEPYSSYINEMWTARGYPNLTGRDTDWYWSAACMSFFLENANYTKTKLSISHSTYIHEAIQNRVTHAERDFWGYRRMEARPQVGDIICQWREYETTFEQAETKSQFPSHTDLVIAVRDRSVITLGGNVANPTSGGRGVSVETKTFSLTADGFLPDARNVFAIMKNNYRPRQDQAIV